MRSTFLYQYFFASGARLPARRPLRDNRITQTALAFICLAPTLLLAQNKYGLNTMKYDAYKASLEASPGNELVNL